METTIKKNEVTCVLQTDAIVGESPVWCSQEQILYWVDIIGHKVHYFNPRTSKNTTLEIDQPVTGVARRKQGGLIAALRDGFAFIDLEKGNYTPIVDPESHLPDNRFNDAKCDRQGRLWGGTMGAKAWDKPVGSLYRLDTNFTVHMMETETICSNGMGWSPDGTVMYFTESFRHTVFAYDFDQETGNISNRRPFAVLDPELVGFPDGLTVDAQGYVWVAICGASKVVRYNLQGEIDFTLNMPIPRPTSCIFGGADYDILYITSAQETLTPEDLEKYPLSGSLFAFEPGVKGIPETPFNG